MYGSLDLPVSRHWRDFAGKTAVESHRFSILGWTSDCFVRTPWAFVLALTAATFIAQGRMKSARGTCRAYFAGRWFRGV